MQQRQLRLGDILDDYCPRERRVTNHAVVAMVGADVKQTRCTTCDAEHEYKHAKVPRQRRKADTPAALYAQVRPAVRSASRTNADERRRTGETRNQSRTTIDDRRHRQRAGVSGDVAEHATVPRTAAMAANDDARADDDRRRAKKTVRFIGRSSARRCRGLKGSSRRRVPIPEFTIRQPGGRPGADSARAINAAVSRDSSSSGNRGNGNIAAAVLRAACAGNGGRPQGAMPMGRRHGARRARPEAVQVIEARDSPLVLSLSRRARGSTSSPRAVNTRLTRPCLTSPENTASSSASPTSDRFRGRSRRRRLQPARASR